MAQHARLKIEAGVRVSFLRDPHSPWQRGNLNENTNRSGCASTSPKGPISACTAPTRLAAVAAALNSRPPESTLAIGRHPQRRLTGFSYQPTKIVLRRPLESALRSCRSESSSTRPSSPP